MAWRDGNMYLSLPATLLKPEYERGKHRYSAGIATRLYQDQAERYKFYHSGNHDGSDPQPIVHILQDALENDGWPILQRNMDFGYVRL